MRKSVLAVAAMILLVGAAAVLSAAWGGQTESPPRAPRSTFGGVSLKLDYATTDAEREQGLGGRVSLTPDEAMLFVFPKDDFYGFWMKDTLIPLDMFWFDDKGQVIYIERNVATSTYPHVFYPPVPARYVLEANAGFADAHGIAIGTPLELKNIPLVSQ